MSFLSFDQMKLPNSPVAAESIDADEGRRPTEVNHPLGTGRPLSRAEFQNEVAALKQLFPWLQACNVQPAPGHLALVKEVAERVDKLMAVGLRDEKNFLFSAMESLGSLSLQVNVPAESHRFSDALGGLERYAWQRSAEICCVCGAAGRREWKSIKGARCASHRKRTAMFAGEVRRGHRKSATPAATVPSPPTEVPTVTVLRVAFPDEAAVARMQARGAAMGGRWAGSARAIADRIGAIGYGFRELAVLPTNWQAVLNEFEDHFPNFGELAEYLCDHFSLAGRGDGGAGWPPVMLVGAAGIGKTEAARWISHRLGLPMGTVDMAAAQSGSQLAGSESYWANSQPGALFELLAYNKLANPVMLLDEIDKAAKRREHDPLAGLYTLLEPSSARTFRDLSIRDFAIDASHVNWIATANDARELPSPLKSRMTTIHIERPSPEQALQIARNIYRRLIADTSSEQVLSGSIAEEVLAWFGDSSPRDLSLVMRRAMGSAIREGRDRITLDDLPNGYLGGIGASRLSH